ncbi:MAG TPA: hypothetical protein PK210_05090 [Bacteroidia bacterium]|nr:hypothetical protein [Bacteroidia bacterium]
MSDKKPIYIGSAKQIEGSNNLYGQLDLTALNKAIASGEIQTKNVEFKDGVHELISFAIFEKSDQFKTKHQTHSLTIKQ